MKYHAPSYLLRQNKGPFRINIKEKTLISSVFFGNLIKTIGGEY